MMNTIRIDLVSDTATRPGEGMRAAMANAEVGDEQRGEDPSTTELCQRVAGMLGKQEAMFLPSGIMCNQVAIAAHCQRGDEIYAAEYAHVIGSEGAGAAVFAGSFIRPVPGERGIFNGESLLGVLRKPKPKSPRSRLVCVEQTVNRGGGAIWPLEALASVAEAARANGLAVHMDGARLLNASVATGTPPSRYAQDCDSVWLDLSKGLGCPVGGVLAGSARFMEDAWEWKYRFGGGMRQTGILAAAGLFALDNNVERLSEDHANAQRFAGRLANIPGIRLEFADTQSNIVFFNVSGTGQRAEQLAARLQEQGIRIGVENETSMRAVTHLDVSRQDIDEAADTLGEIVLSGNGAFRAAAR